MKLKRILALTLCVVMLMSVVPCVSFAAETKSVIDSIGGTVLWSAPDGSFDDTAVSTAWNGWTSDITSGYVNVKTYSTGNTLQYYVNGTSNVTNVVSPGYGAGADKIIIEWKMKRDYPSDLYFDFSFRDIDGNEIVFLKLDKNALTPGTSHPENDEIYALGFPESGTECAIVAYNNSDGETHTADYYVAGEIVYTQNNLDGTVNGFKSIVSDSGKWSTAWKHIGFSDLTIGYYSEETIEETFKSIDLADKITKIYDEIEVTLPETASVLTNLGRLIEADITWEKNNVVFPEGDNVVNGVAVYTLGGEECQLPVSMTISVLPVTFELDATYLCNKNIGDVQIDFPMNITGEFYLSYYFTASDMRNCWVYISNDGALWGNGQIGLGTADNSTATEGYFKAMVSDGDATLVNSEIYYIVVHGDVEKDIYSLSIVNYETGEEICTVNERDFRKASEQLNSMKLSVNGYSGSFQIIYPRVYYKTYEESKAEYTIVTIKDGVTTTTTGFYLSADEITTEEIDGYNITKTVDGTTVTFVYERLVPCSITFTNVSGDIIAQYEGEDNEIFTVAKTEVFVINSEGEGAFYTIPQTDVTTVAMTQIVYETENKYAVIEDAFVDQNKIYGINSTNSNGVMVASFDDSNRGPAYDANGEATFLEGSSPTTLGRSRVGVVKFPVVDVGENQKVYANFYVKSWHSQGFDGGNSYLKIAATPINSEFWAVVSEGSACTFGYLFTLDYWNSPIFTGKCENKEGYVKLDITEAIKKAKSANLSEITLKLQIYWGAAYIAEREAAIVGGSYEGKASYIEVCDCEKLYTVTSSGSATLTKNGSVMQDECVAESDDDIRLVFDGAYAIKYDEGVCYNNKKLNITEDSSFTETYPVEFGLTMVSGAQVRFGGGVDKDGKVGENNGLRFITMVDRNETLAGFDDAVLGVLVQAEDSDNAVEILAEKWQSDTVFTSAITNLSVNNYNRNYIATPFVRIGENTFTGDSVTRSIYYVASGLLTSENSDGTEYDEDAIVSETLYKVLNAYVNQVGIRLALTKTGLSEYNGTKGKYTSDAFFTVKDAKIEGDICYITLVPVGEKTVINTDYYSEYVRINNNNSIISQYTSIVENDDGTYTFSLDTSSLGVELERPKTIDELKPTYDGAVEILKNVNSYWQSYQSYDNWYGSTHPAFWDKAAYHTGNIEMYKLLGDEDYLQYSIDWANYNEWKGNNSTSDPSTWTWGYNQTQGSSAVLFGDWQICFQTYIDLYDMGIDGASVDRVYEVIDYQISKDEDSFWWWADGLYMVMPVMTKLYKQTNDEKYLDALYKYFKYAKELMYDGNGGIPTSADGYTTSATLTSGAYYSDADDYKNLFYRDAGYVYPLQPNTGHETEKNFWSRGNGWVFAGLSKVLSDMPEDYEHYDEFKTTYLEMAEAIVNCQMVDSYGYGFWTQSMLQGYPVSDENPNGYETSGTAFFTYGLFWGINAGLLENEKYEEAAIRAWGYLENIALQSSGKVGYVQPIGSKATEAVSVDTTANFGVGAYLLAGCEATRWAESQ